MGLAVLVDVAPRLLTAFPKRASAYAKRRLESTGVDVETLNVIRGQPSLRGAARITRGDPYQKVGGERDPDKWLRYM